MIEFDLTINGFDLKARYGDDTRAQVFDPLIARMAALRRALGRPAVVLLAAPPGAGKSTLAHALARCAHDIDIAPLGLDGFHYPNSYLAAHPAPDGAPLKSIKGAPETYDLARLRRALTQLPQGGCAWPQYDRRLHDIAPEPLMACGDVFIVEGNWLLLDEPGWRELRGICDLSVSIAADEEVLLPRLIARKMRGGLSREEATAFCMRSDLANIRRYRSHLLPADVQLAEHEADGCVCLAPVSQSSI